ncbi:uncharacterized protein LOC135700898 isoform X2 [Ochlerotatus camptorhynchus]|uniref:uncharacterized protein LOC135700898 isoform X2 n=1 Tax=Ochlerotatus camptorhynchus TaxID=644619 RepID=UPI0031E46014
MKFAVATPLIGFLILGTISCTSARAAHDGKYNKRKYNYGNHGKYVHTNGGDYVEDLDRYRYVHYDDGDRGRYIHSHVPYDGGFGNYEGGHEPFRNPPYDATGLYADSSLDNPYKSNEYDIKQPSIYLEYGTPESEYVDASSRQEKQTSAAIGLDPRASTFPGTAYLPVPRPPTEYGPPKRANANASTKQVKGATTLRSINIGSISLTTTSGQESKLDFVTKAPETTRNRITVSQRMTPESSTSTTRSTKASTTAASTKILTTTKTTTVSSVATTTAKASIEEQLYQCRAELQAALLKLSHDEHAKRD